MMNSVVLDHIVRATEAKPTGPEKHSGHCPGHGSNRHWDLNIKVTPSRILLHCFAGCTPSQVVSALGLTLADLFFDNARNPRGARKPPKPKRPDHRRIALDLELYGIALQDRADAVLHAASGMDCSAWSDSDLNAALDAVGKAHHDHEYAEVLFSVADSQRDKAYQEETR